MKLTINADERYTETEIIVNCNRMNDDIEKLLAAIRMFDMKLMGLKNGEHCLIDITHIVYIESTDKRTFFYTLMGGVYESHYKLYELEEKLSGKDFLRASKNCLFNIAHIHSLKTDLEQRLILTYGKRYKNCGFTAIFRRGKRKIGGLSWIKPEAK